MANLSATETDSLTEEELVRDIAKIQHVFATFFNIHLQAPPTCIKDDQICLSDLHQVYIDGICKHLTLKESIRLQRTCKDLYQKGFHAQRLITHPLNMEIRPANTGYPILRSFLGEDIFVRSFGRLWREKQIEATNCRFHIDVNATRRLTLEDIRRITDVLGGRASINKINFSFDGVSPEVDSDIFNQFLQDFNVSELSILEMPQDFLQLTAVKQLMSLNLTIFPLSLLYLLDTSIHTCRFFLRGRRTQRPDLAEMHEVLEKWTRNEKVIKNYSINRFNWDENAFFSGWGMVDEGQEIPEERPIVIRNNSDYYYDRYRVVRADGAFLEVNYSYYQLHVW